MGARSNVVIQDGDERVYLYGHWMACRSIEHAAVGPRSDRYDDSSFLARIVFDSMVGRTQGNEIGFGISASLTDNQFPILVIDAKHGSSAPGAERTRGATSVWFEWSDGTRASRTYSREEFLAIAETIPPYRDTWDEQEHDCGFSRFVDPDPDEAEMPALDA